MMEKFIFDKLWKYLVVKKAFEIIFVERIRCFGYFDVSMYIKGRLKKKEMYKILALQNSKYTVLYAGPYPKTDQEKKDSNLNEIDSLFKNQKNFETLENENSKTHDNNKIDLTYEEASAIVNWVYRWMKNIKERQDFTREFCDCYLKKEYKLDVKLKYTVVYDPTIITIHFCSSVFKIISVVSSLRKEEQQQMFYRGHSNMNYELRPSVMRTDELKKNESVLYNELLINCPEEFEDCYTHFEKLVKMQHYGLPTRLLDITKNILVAIFFACIDSYDNCGELVLISDKNDAIKYAQSDTISLLASLPLFSSDDQERFLKEANTYKDIKSFNENISRLISEVQLEKPAFKSEVKPEDILGSYIVYALKKNERIIRQDGAFIICGLNNEKNFLEKFRWNSRGKKVLILIQSKDKKKILKELENVSINQASLFPEIECVAEYLKNKYSKA